MGQKRYPSKSSVFMSRFSFKVRQQGKQQLNLQCVKHNLNNDRSSLISTMLLVHTTTPTISTKNLFVYFTHFSPSYPPWLVHKNILTISFNTPFLYTSSIFHLTPPPYSHPYNLHQKHLPYPSFSQYRLC